LISNTGPDQVAAVTIDQRDLYRTRAGIYSCTKHPSVPDR